ncbi:MAG: DUF3108 domain-containing protein [Epsilonproteobacteria bacterium]|nr:DUF3108 domain-containing protein [Campylobacterota bacterium]
MKLLLSTLITISTAFGASLKYKVYAPLFGEIGEVNIQYSTTPKSYSIDANLRTYGFAKTLSGNRAESYSSTGFIKNNNYYSNKFAQHLTYKNKKSYLEYVFDYKNKKVIKKRKKWVDGKIKTNYSKPLPYFTYNDLLNSYHNIVTNLKGKPAGVYRMKVAGMEKYGGDLLIKIPSKKVQQKEAKSMKVDGGGWVFHIVTKKRILKSKSGEIIFVVGDDGIAKAVRVIDIPIVSYIDARLTN